MYANLAAMCMIRKSAILTTASHRVQHLKISRRIGYAPSAEWAKTCLLWRANLRRAVWPENHQNISVGALLTQGSFYLTFRPEIGTIFKIP